jgi:CubicO group peptidase (beta-lactamase class C family)
MALDGRVALDDRLDKYLPSGGAVTLCDLATHTAGYPRLPLTVGFRLRLLYSADTYAALHDRDVERAMRRIGRRTEGLRVCPTHQYTYSNFGYGVLSRALSAVAGKSFPELVRAEILDPLGLTETTFDIEDRQERVAGRRSDGRTPPPVINRTLPGAVSMLSTITDIKKYIEANLEPDQTPLRDALEGVHLPRIKRDTNSYAGLGWVITSRGGATVTWHNGGTSGFGSIVAFEKKHGVGIGLLVAQQHHDQMDAAAMAALTELISDGLNMDP